MITSFKKNSKGFSLIEMLVYISMLVIMLLLIVQMISSILKTERTSASARRIESSAIFALDRIGREIRNAESVDATSVLNTTSGSLVLNSLNASGTPVISEFSLISGVLHLKTNGVDTGALTRSNVTVTQLKFNLLTSSTTEAVKIELKLDSGTSTTYRTETFYSTVVLRGTYDN